MVKKRVPDFCTKLTLNISYMWAQFCGVSKQIHSFFTSNNLSNACLEMNKSNIETLLTQLN